MKRKLEMLDSLKTWLEAGAGFFYPECCCVCGNEHATPAEGYVCAKCREQVRYIEPPICSCCGMPFPGDITTAFECSNCLEMEFYFSKARAVLETRGIGLDLVHRYKYRRQMWLEALFADVLERFAAPVLREENWELLVPVPLHPVKEAEREFNQATRLAQLLSDATGIPVERDALVRCKMTPTQTTLDRKARVENMKGAFKLKNAKPVADKRVVLIDDVFTTGATTNACAKLLSKAGAADICVWSLARAVDSPH